MNSKSTRSTIEKKTSVRNSISRLVFAGISIIIQVVWFMTLITKLNEYSQWVSTLTNLIALVLVVGIYGRHMTSAMKIPWIMLILVFPIFGTTMYLLVGFSGTTKKMRIRYEKIDRTLFAKIPQDPAVMEQIKQQDYSVANISHYITESARYPIYQNTDVTYYADAADGLEAQKAAMKKAKKFIFMEYHAIEDAESWHGIQDILAQKVKEGVEVRIFYDDMGSVGFIDADFIERMKKLGIQCRVFNPMMPILNFFLNNRDHRKITVIDGKVGFTGGYNLANEYFNLTHPYGYWKDTGVKLEGDAVRSLTVMFLEMWNAIRESDTDDTDFDQYLIPSIPRDENKNGNKIEEKVIDGDSIPAEDVLKSQTQGFVQPYADSPLDDEQTGENVYINIINQAQHYVWFTTPYLIITDEMNHALGLAAKRGVDVRIITPGIPDKKTVYSVTRSYYAGLVRKGVRIFEYTPGFCHAKQCISDGKVATCGTINLDFRSLYHHFENGCLFYNCEMIKDMKKDFDETFKLCQEVTEQYKYGRSAVLRIRQCVLRLFAALL